MKANPIRAAVTAVCALCLLVTALPAEEAAPADGRLPLPEVRENAALEIDNPLEEVKRPVMAVWRDTGGHLDRDAPYLRVAVWADGRVVFTRDPERWDHELLIGRIEPARLAKLLKDLGNTAVFRLEGTTYLVPSAPSDCVMLAFGGRKQMLYWDEVETPNYGIGGSKKPRHVVFRKTWWEVNRLILGALPAEVAPFDGRFEKVPRSWYLREAIQSE